MKLFLLSLLISLSVQAGLPLDIVFDIDLTIVAIVQDGPGGDQLADPTNPGRNVVTVGDERYRIYDGLRELMEKLEKEQKAGKIRISFFSGGEEVRNEELLKKIKLSNGRSLWDLAPGRVLGRSSMTPTGREPPARIRERFKKDLTKINPDLSDVILIDDIKEFVPESQRGNMLWIGEDFPYPDRTHTPPEIIDPDLLAREKNKYQWISSQLDDAMKLRFATGRPLSTIVQEMTSNHTLTPFSARNCDTYRILSDLFTK